MITNKSQPILDCENVETAYNSVENLLGLSKRNIHTIFESIDYDNYFNEHDFNGLDNLFIKRLSNYFDVTTFDCNYVYWFHASRIGSKRELSNGILPLNQSINKIWNFLFSLVRDAISKEEWNNFRIKLDKGYYDFYSSELYLSKLTKKIGYGPFAFLIKEIIYNPDNHGNHDYLRTPEIVEDICITFKEYYDIDLLESFIRNTSPVIVKFKLKNFSPILVGVVLSYLYCKYLDKELVWECNHGCSNNGLKIPGEDVLKIEVVHNQQKK